MAEIFISYSREDRDWVERLASQLQSEGYSVWWDWDLLVGKRYRETIDNELQTCRAAVVVWSQHSIQSDFVRDEAEEAQQRNILVPILKEMVRPPAGFRQIQTADLSTWTGGSTHAEFRRVMKGIGFMVGRPAATDAGGTGVPDPHSASRIPSSSPADTANLSKSTAGSVVKTPIATRSESTNRPALLSRLPPASHRIWRYAAFAVVALVGVLLIVSYLPSASSKPPAPASVIGGPTPTPVNAAATSDGGDIGQTGPRNAPAPPGPPAAPAPSATGDDGDVGQGTAH
ncbi:MAG TPA: toll/interleukin-1 receptor domain-containing protein [Rhizomicrobium sp.]|jgi:hypothetical protein